MSIVLNAGASINGEMPSIGDFGESDADKNSLFGNFGDLLNIISADAENAVLSNNTTPQITESKQWKRCCYSLKMEMARQKSW